MRKITAMPLLERTCQCGKKFRIKQSEASSRKYCSIRCYRKVQRSHCKREANPKEIERLYNKEKLSAPRIAKIFGCGNTLIYTILKKQRVRLRDRHEANRGHDPHNKIKLDPEEILHYYFVVGESLQKIAKRYDCDISVIRRLLSESGRKARTLKQAHKYRKEYAVIRPDLDRTKILEQYKKGLSTWELAKFWNCDKGTIVEILNKAGFATRSQKEAAINKLITKPEEMERLRRQSLKLVRPAVKTKLGILVRSKPEKRIADWLYEHGIDYSYEEKRIATYWPDFYLSKFDCFIEYDGNYRKESGERNKRKKQVYEQLKIKYLFLYPSDMRNFGEKIMDFIWRKP